MPTISMCPKCHRSVSLPADIAAAALVRCPLCRAEYPLSEAIPPKLIPVDSLTIEASGWAREMMAEADREKEIEEQENEAAAVVERISLGISHLHQRGAKAWWRTPLEIVFGAFVGCLIAYYGLALWLGPELKNRGFPVLSVLPGITRLTTSPEGADDVKEEPNDDEKQGAGG